MVDSKSLEARDEFEVFRHRTYLNWASLSPAPARAIRAVTQMASQAASFRTGSVDPVWHPLSNQLREEAGRLINAPAEEIAVCGSSTTQGIQLAFDAIRPATGDNIVTCDMEFPSSGAELRKWKAKGTEIRIARSSGGSFTPDDVIELIDGRTKAVVLSSVSWVNGFRPDVETISRAAHEKGSYVVLDSVQHMGAMEFDTRKLRPDFAAAGGQKWLTSPFGAALLYVSRRAIEELEPPHYSLNNSPEPEEGWNSYFARRDKTGFEEFASVPAARKMEYGGWLNHVGMVALKESIALINSVGSSNVQRRIRDLSRVLREELEGMKFNVISPADEKSSSSITTFEAGGAEASMKTVNRLFEKGIDVSCRGGSGIGGVRVSVHHMNTEDDILRLTTALRELKAA